VLLLERDGPSEEDGADRLFECWERPGVAHFRQPHNFLALARQVLLEKAPDVLDTVVGLGALENRQYELLPGQTMPDDEAFVSICARRPVFESALRRAVSADTKVELEAKTRVVALLADDVRSDGALRIRGVRTDREQDIHADLVVDALGRTSPVGPWLKLSHPHQGRSLNQQILGFYAASALHGVS
jgi:2-polyprenyl-6-methoxyphenol hydroxylase-like FAD-dependent oxidoreductase